MAYTSFTFDPWGCVTQRIAKESGVLVRVKAVHGSAPREPGAWMVVFGQDAVGSIGGGHLEWQAMALARQHLADPGWQEAEQRCALGPSLGQCCGGVVHLAYERMNPSLAAVLQAENSKGFTPVVLFGGGHVGRAIVQALAPLPFTLTWVDSREDVFPEALPPTVCLEHSSPVQAAVPGLAAGSRVLVMSFSHAEDLDIVAACLMRQRQKQDLPFVGLIGSKVKWASFRQRLKAQGFTEAELAHVTCPIGLPGIVGKQPAVIAASVTAQLLTLLTPPAPV